jgi:hypothetical protein
MIGAFRRDHSFRQSGQKLNAMFFGAVQTERMGIYGG